MNSITHTSSVPRVQCLRWAWMAVALFAQSAFAQFPAPYCNVTFPSGREPITLVRIGDIDNRTNATINGTPPLENFLHLSTDLAIGNAHDIRVEGNTDGEYINHFVAFFDFNHDGDFDDQGERFILGSLYDSDGDDGQHLLVPLTIPTDATPGLTRMRIVKRFNTVPGPCNAAGYGQAEDYTVNLLSLPSFTVTPSAGPNGSINPDQAFQVLAGQPAILNIQPEHLFRVDEVTGSCGGTLSGPVQGPNQFTTEPLQGDCDVHVTFTPRDPIFPEPYCAYSVNEDVEPITRVLFGDIDNSSSAALNGSPALENFTAEQTALYLGFSHDIAVEGHTFGEFTNHIRVYVDWNQDGDFDDADEGFNIGTLYNSNGSDGQQASAQIQVPLDALLGPTRMRVTKRFSSAGGPCNTTGWAQAEDYTVLVSPSWTVGGAVSGLLGDGLVLQNNDDDDLIIDEDGPFTFATRMITGDSYEITVATQPTNPSQTCMVKDGSGIIADDDVADVVVECETNRYLVSASVAAGEGSIDPAQQTVSHGENALFQVEPAHAWTVDAVAGDTCTPSDAGSGEWTATAVVQACDVHAHFVPAQPMIVAGTGQSVTIGSAFAEPLIVRVTDAHGQPWPGLSVRFEAPAAGASATLSAITATTNAHGIATVSATANAQTGNYTVTAQIVDATGIPALSFALSNASAIFTLGAEIDDGRDHVRYGQLINYLVRVDNNGPHVAHAIEVEVELSDGLDEANASWLCLGPPNTGCTTQGTGPLVDTLAALQVGQQTTWLLTVPVLTQAEGDEIAAMLTVVADGNNLERHDSATLVVHRSGFESNFIEGSQQPLIIAIDDAVTVLELPTLTAGESSLVTLPTDRARYDHSTIEMIARSRLHSGEPIRIERLYMPDGQERLRLVIRTANGERSGNWLVWDGSTEPVLHHLESDDGTRVVLDLNEQTSSVVLPR